MTETGMVLSNPLSGDRVPGTVGFPLPGVTVKIDAPKVLNAFELDDRYYAVENKHLSNTCGI